MILLIESSAQFPSVGICNLQGELLGSLEKFETYSHAESLATMVQEILVSFLGDNQKAKESLKAVAVSEGPGSYTGLRIGASLAKGLAMGYHVPLISVSAMEGMAHEQLLKYPELLASFAMLDARRNEVYMLAKSQNGKILVDPQPMILSHENWQLFLQETLPNAEFLKDVGYVSDCDSKVAELILQGGVKVHEQVPPHVRHLSFLAAQKFSLGTFQDLAYFEPNYLKEFVAGIGKKFQL